MQLKALLITGAFAVISAWHSACVAGPGTPSATAVLASKKLYLYYATAEPILGYRLEKKAPNFVSCAGQKLTVDFKALVPTSGSCGDSRFASAHQPLLVFRVLPARTTDTVRMNLYDSTGKFTRSYRGTTFEFKRVELKARELEQISWIIDSLSTTRQPKKDSFVWSVGGPTDAHLATLIREDQKPKQ
jgi:hypothetical protein